MGTTARIYLVTDQEDPKRRSLSERRIMAKHSRSEVSLFQYTNGLPRTEHGDGVFDFLESAFLVAPKRVLRVSSELAVHLLVIAAQRVRDVELSGYILVPSHPTVGAITYYDYLIVCHARTDEPPSLFVQLGCLWRTDNEFAQAQADDEAGYELLLAAKSQNMEVS